MWESFAITDHAFSIAIPEEGKSWPHCWYENGTDLDYYISTGVAAQRIEEYLEFCKTFRDGKRFFQGIEIESDANGRTAVPLDVLKQFDVVIASIHYNPGEADRWVERHFFQLDKVLQIPCDIIGHPIRHLRHHSSPDQTLPKELIDETLDRIQNAGVALEINAHYPQFHDDILMLQGAAERGMKVSFSMDLHYPEEFGNWRYFEDVVEQSGIDYDQLKLFTPKADSSHHLTVKRVVREHNPTF